MTFYQKPYLHLLQSKDDDDDFDGSLITPIDKAFSTKTFVGIDPDRTDETYETSLTLKNPGSAGTDYVKNTHPFSKASIETTYKTENFVPSETGVTPPYGVAKIVLADADKEGDYSETMIPPYLYLRKESGTGALQLGILIENSAKSWEIDSISNPGPSGNDIIVTVNLKAITPGTGLAYLVTDLQWSVASGTDYHIVEVTVKVGSSKRGKGKLKEKNADNK